MNKRFGRRGVTLLETVIAMLLLTIITGTAFAVCSSAATSVARTGKEFAVINFCEDVVEYYKAASDKSALICCWDTFARMILPMPRRMTVRPTKARLCLRWAHMAARLRQR